MVSFKYHTNILEITFLRCSKILPGYDGNLILLKFWFCLFLLDSAGLCELFPFQRKIIFLIINISCAGKHKKMVVIKSGRIIIH